MPLLILATAALALLGHAAIWIGLVNRLHATGVARPIVKSLTFLGYTTLVALPAAALAAIVLFGPSWFLARTWELDPGTLYVAFAAVYGAAQLVAWGAWHWRSRQVPGAVRKTGEQVVDMVRQLGFSPALGWRTRVLSRAPFNQLWQLHINAFEIRVPRLPAALDGVTLCHWSDLHYCGRIDRPYFEEVVRLTNAMRPDLILLSGDICDLADCIDWICPTLGPAQARHGKYYVLGNHDLRTHEVGRLRDAMRAAGFVDLGNRQEVILDGQMVIAGNELPWITTASEPDGSLPASDDAVRVLLSHSPDQLNWARGRGFDVMLAGHTHGGQIRFPVIGPIVCPSWHGTKYASGFFYEPPTLLHVSRGTASLLPVRINCPPEITRLVLRAQPLPADGRR